VTPKGCQPRLRNGFLRASALETARNRARRARGGHVSEPARASLTAPLWVLWIGWGADAGTRDSAGSCGGRVCLPGRAELKLKWGSAPERNSPFAQTCRPPASPVRGSDTATCIAYALRTRHRCSYWSFQAAAASHGDQHGQSIGTDRCSEIRDLFRRREGICPTPSTPGECAERVVRIGGEYASRWRGSPAPHLRWQERAALRALVIVKSLWCQSEL